MGTERIIVDGEEQDVEVKPLTLICPSAFPHKIDYPGRVEISMQETTYHMKRVQKLHPYFYILWELVHKNEPPCPADSDEIRKLGAGHIHLGGLLDLSLKFIDTNTPFVWKYPESLLHPAIQVELGTVACILSQKAQE